jgi:RimJ/RimL family protein N-acetyltransferase
VSPERSSIPPDVLAGPRLDVRTLRATVSHNTGSRAIIEAAGFVRVGEQDDPEDGLELIYERSARGP